jgi:peroxiredoxin
LAEYRDRFSELTSLGLGLAGLSVDAPPASRALVEQLGLPFPLLCDPGREVVQAYGVFNREEKGGIAYPATFVLDRDRTVRFRSLDGTVSRVDLDGLFAFLRSGLHSAAPATPARSSHGMPRFGDFRRAMANALRHGIRSPRS